MIMRLPETFDKFIDFHGPAKCSHDGCDKRAAYGMTIKVWAEGYGKNTPPLDMLFTIKVCADHRYTPKPDEFWTPEGKAMVTKALRALHRADPDFDTSEFDWQPLATVN